MLNLLLPFEIKQDSIPNNASVKDIPKVKEVTEDDIQEHYLPIKLDVDLVIENEVRKLQVLKRKGDETDNYTHI